MSQLAATRVGIVGVPSAWLVVYGGLAVFFLHVRGMYSWQLRLSMLESARKVIAATALAAMTVVSLRILCRETSTTWRRKRCGCSPSARST